MSISQDEAVRLLNHVIFRPGWGVSARPAPGSASHVLAGIEVVTVDSSFVTRGGEYTVPLTERTVIRMDASDYATPEALLAGLLAFIQELQGHEDREFLRAWDGEAERWAAPFHPHAPEGQRAWDRARALPPPAVTRLGTGDGPWLAAGCEDDSGYVCWAEEDSRLAVSALCDNEDDRGDCWESGNGRAMVSAAPCNEQTDDDQDEGPQRVPVGVRAACYQDGEVSCVTDINGPARA